MNLMKFKVRCRWPCPSFIRRCLVSHLQRGLHFFFYCDNAVLIARLFQGTKRKTSAVRRSGDAAAGGGSDGAAANPFRNSLGIQFE